MTPEATIATLVTGMQLAQRNTLMGVAGWPHPGARELIAPVRRLTCADLSRAMDLEEKRGLPRFMVHRAIRHCTELGYDNAETIAFLGEIGIESGAHGA